MGAGPILYATYSEMRGALPMSSWTALLNKIPARGFVSAAAASSPVTPTAARGSSASSSLPPLTSPSSTSSSPLPTNTVLMIPRLVQSKFPHFPPLKRHMDQQLSSLGPDEYMKRSRLFQKRSKIGLKAGDILQIQSYPSMALKSSPIPFAGVIMAIRYQGLDSSVTLKHLILKTGVEQSFKVYSPLIHSITLLKRAVKRRKNRWYFLRHNMKWIDWAEVDVLAKAALAKDASSVSV